MTCRRVTEVSTAKNVTVAPGDSVSSVMEFEASESHSTVVVVAPGIMFWGAASMKSLLPWRHSFDASS